MAGLKIFDTDTATISDRPAFDADVVGRFRTGFAINGKPQTLDSFRVTSGDPEVMAAVAEKLGGEVQDWTENIEREREETLELFTEADKVRVVLEGPDPIRQKFTLRNPATGEVVRSGDGETLDDGRPDPQAGQTFQERKQAARDGMGAKPDISVTFRIEGLEGLGKFRLATGSWDFASDLHYYEIPDRLAAAFEEDEDAKVSAVLSLEQVSFTAKTGPRAGKTVTYRKPALTLAD